MPLLALTAAAGAAEAIDDDDRAAMRRVIRAQMDAFLADDAELAFSYASPSIRERYGDARVFMQSVAAAYRPVYRPQAVVFQEVVDLGGQPAQRVLVQGPGGETVLAVYPMERQDDGSWRIAGCYLLRSEAQML